MIESQSQYKLTNKYLIIGDARHGKDTLAEIWAAEFDWTYKSSSLAAAEIFIFEALRYVLGYKTPQECFEDRVNHRALWYELIRAYNSEDKTRLAKEIVSDCDGYIGMRDAEEIHACRKSRVFDLVIWVDASKRLPPEDKSSFNIDKSITDIIIPNNESLELFTKRAVRLGKALRL